MRKDKFSLELLVCGRPVREYLHGGEIFIEGRRGSEFTLRVRNNSHRRAVAIVSVDGLSVMNGKAASTTDGGYVIGSYGFVDIPGWRLNDRQIAKFLFDAIPDAYASQIEKPDNIGVIGAVLYYEKPYKVPAFHGIATRGGEMTKGGGFTFGGSSSGIGTGFGSRQEHHVSCVNFTAEENSACNFIMRYEDRPGLELRGIALASAHETCDRVLMANPFPADQGCQPPSNWKG